VNIAAKSLLLSLLSAVSGATWTHQWNNPNAFYVLYEADGVMYGAIPLVYIGFFSIFGAVIVFYYILENDQNSGDTQ